jgi:long-subunit fatty acid transport protein
MKRNLFIAVAFLASTHLFGQGEIDAYRFSKNDLSGTARGQAMGGAFGALGGDITGVAINPAGIAVYRSSEIIFNAGLTVNQTKTDFNGTENLTGNTNLTCDNFAYSSYLPLGNDDRYSFNFGFNYNRLKNFDRTYNVSGKGMGSSLTDYMAEITFGTPGSFWDNYNSEEQFYASEHPHWLGILGWNSYLINESQDGYESLLAQGEKVAPHLKVREKGSVGAYDFTLGTNLDNNVYLGAAISFTNISYSTNTSYNETFEWNGGFNLANEYVTEGSGMQIKLGAIFRPTDALRLGISYHSPTWYQLTDYYWGKLSPYDIYIDEERTAEPALTPSGAYHEYEFKTPDVWTLSAAVVLGQTSIVSLDYEYKNYSEMTFSKRYWNDYDFTAENEYINADFKGASTIRAGMETRFTSQFSGRLGFAWMQNPYNSQFKNSEIEAVTPGTIPNYTLEGHTLYLTTGVGFRFTPHFYMDLALVYRTQEDKLHFFSPLFYSDTGEKYLDSTPARLINSTFKTQLTFGYKF